MHVTRLYEESLLKVRIGIRGSKTV